MCFSAGRLRIINVEPFSSAIWCLRNSDRRRVMVSRLVPMSCEISSWVMASRTRTFPLLTSPSAAVSSKNLANLSDTECDNPIVRTTP